MAMWIRSADGLVNLDWITSLHVSSYRDDDESYGVMASCGSVNRWITGCMTHEAANACLAEISNAMNEHAMLLVPKVPQQ